jgi:quercetin dioxygenase-like cupin family protein
MTFALWEIDDGAILPEHHHPHEQVVHMLQGDLEITVGGETRVLRAGSVGVIAAHLAHSARALSRCRVMDVFYPRREDYMDSGTPSLLQDAFRRSAQG